MPELVESISCPKCGGPLNLTTGEVIVTCPYCGTASRIRGDKPFVLTHSMLAARVDRDGALRAIQGWMEGGVMKPDDLRKASRITSLDCTYLPFYVFEVDATTAAARTRSCSTRHPGRSSAGKSRRPPAASGNSFEARAAACSATLPIRRRARGPRSPRDRPRSSDTSRRPGRFPNRIPGIGSCHDRRSGTGAWTISRVVFFRACIRKSSCPSSPRILRLGKVFCPRGHLTMRAGSLGEAGACQRRIDSVNRFRNPVRIRRRLADSVARLVSEGPGFEGPSSVHHRGYRPDRGCAVSRIGHWGLARGSLVLDLRNRRLDPRSRQRTLGLHHGRRSLDACCPKLPRLAHGRASRGGSVPVSASVGDAPVILGFGK